MTSSVKNLNALGVPVKKTPRDFVHVDELWEADKSWRHHFIGNKVWVFVDEYRAELAGDEDYSRIIIRSGEDEGWLYSRSLKEKKRVHQVLESIVRPVSEQQLQALGFTHWQEG